MACASKMIFGDGFFEKSLASISRRWNNQQVSTVTSIRETN